MPAGPTALAVSGFTHTPRACWPSRTCCLWVHTNTLRLQARLRSLACAQPLVHGRCSVLCPHALHAAAAACAAERPGHAHWLPQECAALAHGVVILLRTAQAVGQAHGHVHVLQAYKGARVAGPASRQSHAVLAYRLLWQQTRSAEG